MAAPSLGAPDPTPGGEAPAVILCVLPIVFLLLTTVVRQLTLPTSVSLPLAAALLALIRLCLLSTPADLVAACLFSGLLEALTPLSIVCGAIVLFQTMQHTKCLPWMMRQIQHLSNNHPVAEVYLIGFAFAYLVEGASGFGTPVALSAPLLASLGHDPLASVCCLLLMNTLATQFGAVGTPIWFGLGDIGLGDGNLQLVGLKVSVIVGVCAYVIAPLAAAFVVPLRVQLRSALFVAAAISTAVVPATAISMFSYEFPSLLGGLVSVFLTALLARFRVGLGPAPPRGAPAAKEGEKGGECAASAGGGVLSAASQLFSGARQRQQQRAHEAGGALDGVVRQRRARSEPHARDTYSFIAGVGCVAHAPLPTLDFPLTNAPTEYAAATRRDFSAQAGPGEIDDALVAAAAAAVAAAAATGAGTTGEEKAVQAAAAADGGSSKDVAAKVADDSNGGGDKNDVELAAGSGADGGGSLPPAAREPSTLRASHCGGLVVDDANPVVAARARLSLRDALLRTLPLTLTVLLLLLTRIPALPIKAALQSQSPAFVWRLGTLGDFGVSASLVVFLRSIFRTALPVSWKYELGYVPFLIPFCLASLVTLLVHRRDLEVPWHTPFTEAFSRVRGITVATLGALAFVQLIRVGGRGSPAFIIGYYLSSWLGPGFLAISAFLGALGSFFSGSTTVSNLTFGDLQKIAAERIGVPITGLLAVQVAGATIGNSICINNILSAKAVMGLDVGEGEFIRRTSPVALLFLLMAEALGLLWTLGGLLPDLPLAVPNV